MPKIKVAGLPIIRTRQPMKQEPSLGEVENEYHQMVTNLVKDKSKSPSKKPKKEI